MNGRTITVPEEVYRQLEAVSAGDVLGYLRQLGQRPVLNRAQYRAGIVERERDPEFVAQRDEWCEGMISDLGDGTR